MVNCVFVFSVMVSQQIKRCSLTSGRKAAVQSLHKLVSNINESISLNFNLELVTKMMSRASTFRQSKWRDCGLGEFILGVEELYQWSTVNNSEIPIQFTRLKVLYSVGSFCTPGRLPLRRQNRFVMTLLQQID